jgi:hypothetical protein
MCEVNGIIYTKKCGRGPRLSFAYRSMLQPANAAASARKLAGKPAGAALLLLVAAAAEEVVVDASWVSLVLPARLVVVVATNEDVEKELYNSVLFSKRMCGAAL